MAKQNKRDKRVVVNEIRFNLIARKADLLDDITDCDGYSDGYREGVHVNANMLKAIQKIYKEWEKREADDLDSGADPYVEPKD